MSRDQRDRFNKEKIAGGYIVRACVGVFKGLLNWSSLIGLVLVLYIKRFLIDDKCRFLTVSILLSTVISVLAFLNTDFHRREMTNLYSSTPILQIVVNDSTDRQASSTYEQRIWHPLDRLEGYVSLGSQLKITLEKIDIRLEGFLINLPAPHPYPIWFPLILRFWGRTLASMDTCCKPI